MLRHSVRLHLSLETAYGSVALFTSILHNVFLLYHVDMFVSVYKIDKMSFFLGEIVFLIWNCINDPLFGWLSDRHYLQGSKEHPHSDVVTRRIIALQKNGPMLALAFLAFWVAWAYPWLQFLVCMCVYDGFLTMVDLHHSALLADLAVSNEERTKLNSRCSLFSVVGSFSVFVSYLLWHKEDLTRFRSFCGLLACISLVGFVVMCSLLKSTYAAKQHTHQQSSLDNGAMQNSKRLVFFADSSPHIENVNGVCCASPCHTTFPVIYSAEGKTLIMLYFLAVSFIYIDLH